MSSSRGHDPEADVCPACGERCVHGDIVAPTRKRSLFGAKPSDPDAPNKIYGRGVGRPRTVDANRVNKRHRIVCYLDSNSFTELLKIAGGKDMSHVVRGIIEEALKR